MSFIDRFARRLAALTLSLLLPLAAAGEAARPLSEFAHARWMVDQGAPADIWTLALAPSGAMWLGTGLGLYRFDGVRFERYPLRDGQRLASNNINALHLEPDGDIWLGLFAGGAVRLRDGWATPFGEAQGLPGGRVLRFARWGDGALWAAAGDGLARFDGQRWQRVGAELGFQDVGADYVFTDRRGVLWVAGTSRLYWRAPGDARFHDTGEVISRAAVLAQDRAGRVWLSEGRRGTRALPDYPAGTAAPQDAGAATDAAAPVLRGKQLLFADDGSLWLTEAGVGVHRLRDAARVATGQPLRVADMETFAHDDGLPTNVVVPLVQGLDGEVWVGSNHGLSSFRLQRLQRLKALDTGEPEGFAVAALGDGVLALSGRHALAWTPPGDPRPMPMAGRFHAAVRDRTGTLWLADVDAIWRERDGRRERVWLYAERRNYAVLALAPDERGGAWLAAQGAGVLHLGPDGARREPRLEPDGALPTAITAGPDGVAWFGYDDTLLRFDGDSVRRYAAAAGPRVGRTTALHAGASGQVYIGGEAGFARFDGRRFVRLAAEHEDVFAHVTGIVETPAGDLWLNGGRGLVQVQARDLAALPADGEARPNYRLLDWRDGLPGIALQAPSVPTLLLDVQQRLWAATNGGVAWLDPALATRSERMIGVDILGLRAGDHAYRPGTDLELPPGTRNAVIRYSALTLAAAERARFRYRLDGVDTDWQDADTRREASYANLGPGDYRFRVIAANSDGVWSSDEAVLPFRIVPHFWQTPAFAWACGLTMLGLGVAVYRLRMQALARGMQRQLEARHLERERIARELHDTLLQSTQGLIVNIQGVASGMPASDPARLRIELLLDRADEVAVEARARVLDLRTTEVAGTDLLASLQAVGDALAQDGVVFHVASAGEPQPLDRTVSDQLGCIAQEAVRNAFAHARASRIEVELAYGATELVLSVRDDGAGIPAQWLSGDGRPGHWGLPGMRERARHIGARLTVASEVPRGTRVDIRVPARLAYVATLRREGEGG
ncbi:sensor histidine kinase [Roseateles cellulosilyticus]|uniref:Histidine kinase n=1 Tax=Pelomonas cellulosilytica TaxID=2906762 RepID=A0ABS8XUC7_9BURK|nr:triple tyrosine motif-containing protein [Pelomonas sp. P8]MCE4554487.1 histidine kinase [Pelomonas sp. P8]